MGDGTILGNCKSLQPVHGIRVGALFPSSYDGTFCNDHKRVADARLEELLEGHRNSNKNRKT
jgi:hypothetical protein